MFSRSISYLIIVEIVLVFILFAPLILESLRFLSILSVVAGGANDNVVVVVNVVKEIPTLGANAVSVAFTLEGEQVFLAGLWEAGVPRRKARASAPGWQAIVKQWKADVKVPTKCLDKHGKFPSLSNSEPKI